jgi:hypothetical protein
MDGAATGGWLLVGVACCYRRVEHDRLALPIARHRHLTVGALILMRLAGRFCRSAWY